MLGPFKKRFLRNDLLVTIARFANKLLLRLLAKKRQVLSESNLNLEKIGCAYLPMEEMNEVGHDKIDLLKIDIEGTNMKF